MTSVLYEEEFASPEPLQSGDEIAIHFATKTLEGGVLESSRGRDPFRFRLGDSTVVSGLNEALLGRCVGDQVNVRLSPDKSFGRKRDNWLVTVPLSQLPNGIAVGDQVQVMSEQNQFPAWVRKVSENQAVLDANHPLADETTLLEVDIISAQPADLVDRR